MLGAVVGAINYFPAIPRANVEHFGIGGDNAD
jgi:hypothetical protein